MQIGIVGLPNVGKSTLFKALTNPVKSPDGGHGAGKQIAIANYPFTTIDPNVGVVEVPDERLKILAGLSHSKKIVPTAIEFIDIAGLIKGAAEGEGLGNKFLANIREVDAVAHVVRVFEDKNIIHVHSKVDPVHDIEIIKTELALADLQSIEKRKAKKNKNEDLSAGQAGLPELELLASKKVIYVLNASEEQVKNRWQPEPELIKAMGESQYVVLSANFELLLSEASPEEKDLYLTEVFREHSGLDELISKSYKLLDLITFLTTGEDETRAWTAPKNTPIPKASRAIHTDFEKLFIRAEVINWQKLVEAGSWGKARENGTLKLVGRDYIVQDGDVVEIKI
ncbi:MAG: YchF family ATPase [Candidatus Yanofskybacteria bacterium]|nr:YchF family ATPase [Candidatus Yanofskybacteria bacterium]